ncbi:uncharacterized protein L969DRAFT_43627 [Mixia osmundae IAM 14324]|uniref:Uncharacterized protein n=1 Tax=Mixia osmundae (strain CBS 9802 / IAM 14324 / JCM 22182 / KY 12970) TaxID=764103 RepID=G7E3V0_MIXOS|nr:uncharacterized protein L969DRAFT_43627 [Mixia osmundae IAM 14324]KEI41955.1 hypothetical protein L969DRAFT_43627 [Mixia osmundae IAM 14324]GAA97510.1 hypothetical protein E5Q_04188 [Mixia osmundae IAM 14324]
MKLSIGLLTLSASLASVIGYPSSQHVLFVPSGTNATDLDGREPVDFHDPRAGGGRQFTQTPWGAEPLNVIISGRSDPRILSDVGIVSYIGSLGFEAECLNQHFGDRQLADLGDGRGLREERFEVRQAYVKVIGTCIESVVGGSHLRAYRQDGPLARSDAWFLAVSVERSARHNHAIRADGYNLGRDQLVRSALHGTRWKHLAYSSTAEFVELLRPGSHGFAHGIAQDGRVAVLTAHISDDLA